MSRKRGGSGAGTSGPVAPRRRAVVYAPSFQRRSSYINNSRWLGGSGSFDWIDGGGEFGSEQPGGWGNQTPNANLNGFHRLLFRQRDLESFVPNYKGAIDVVVDEVLGKTGVLFNFSAWPELDEAVRYWYPECDYDEGHQLDFVGKQAQMVRMARRDGQFIIRHIHQRDMSRVPMSRIPYQFQLLQIDHLPWWYSMPLPNGGRIHGGREFDASGRLVRYWMFPVHPADFQAQFATKKFPIPIPIDPSEITVVREIGEPGSAVTTPPMRTAAVSTRDSYEILDSESVRMRQVSNTGLLVSAPGYSDDDEEYEEIFPGRPAGMGDEPMGSGDGAQFSKLPTVDPMEPGGVVKVPPGWKIEATRPGEVGVTFGEFLRKQDSRSAIGSGVPYGRYADDYGSYTSDRIAKIADRDFNVRMSFWRNQVLVAQALRPIGRHLAIAACVSGRWTPHEGTDMRQVYTCAVHLPPRENVHQLQGEQAEDLAVAGGRESADDVAARRGKSGASVDMANAIAMERKRLLGVAQKVNGGKLELIPKPPETPVSKMITAMAMEQIQREALAQRGSPRATVPEALVDQVGPEDLPSDTFNDEDASVNDDGFFEVGIPLGTIIPT